MRQSNNLNRLQRDLRHALDADPAAHSYITSSNRRQSLAFALAGILYMLRYQKNSRIMALATVTAVATALWLHVDAISWAALSLAIALVWTAEFANAAIEAAVDLVTPTYHPQAKTAKDVAAGAVLVAALAAAIVGVCILGPPIMAKLQLALSSYAGST